MRLINALIQFHIESNGPFAIPQSQVDALTQLSKKVIANKLKTNEKKSKPKIETIIQKEIPGCERVRAYYEGEIYRGGAS